MLHEFRCVRKHRLANWTLRTAVMFMNDNLSRAMSKQIVSVTARRNHRV
jgi:hypothetical protein